MKKYLVTLICITFVSLTGCSTSQVEITHTNNENTNVQINNEKSPYLKKLDYFEQDVTEVIDTETGVHYFILNDDKDNITLKESLNQCLIREKEMIMNYKENAMITFTQSESRSISSSNAVGTF